MRRMKHKRERRAAKQDPEPRSDVRHHGDGNVSCTFLLGARVRFVSYGYCYCNWKTCGYGRSTPYERGQVEGMEPYGVSYQA